MTHATDTCAYDQAAQTSADYPFFRAQCRGCAIRAMAASSMFHRREQSTEGAGTFRNAMEHLFGETFQEVFHEVKAEFERNRNLRVQLL